MPPRMPLKSSFVCSSCRRTLRRPANSFRAFSATGGMSAKPSNRPDTDDFYALLLNNPLPDSTARTRRPGGASSGGVSSGGSSTSGSKLSSPSATSSSTPDVPNRAQILFGGSRGGTAAERARRAAERDAAAKVVAGVRVPPRPAEPDNCCMSGCVNCVWDLYRDELELWAERRQEAELRLHGDRPAAPRGGRQRVAGGAMAAGAATMDDDGGGSETNWDASDVRLPSTEGLFDSVPVGIREFMRTEKILKQRKKERAERGEVVSGDF